MTYETYECSNPDCEATTVVQTWQATREEPADSTWGDGCRECGDELQEDPIDYDGPEPDYEAMYAGREE